MERFIAYDISRVCVWVCDGFKTQLHLLRVYRVPFFGGRGPNWPGRGHTTALFPGPSSEHPAVWWRAPDWSSNIEYDRGRAAGGNAVERASSRPPPLSRWSRRRRQQRTHGVMCTRMPLLLALSSPYSHLVHHMSSSALCGAPSHTPRATACGSESAWQRAWQRAWRRAWRRRAWRWQRVAHL